MLMWQFGSLCGIKNYTLFWLLVTSIFFIYHLTVMTILTQYQKVKDQINTFERLKTKLTYDVKVEDQIYSLPISFS